MSTFFAHNNYSVGAFRAAQVVGARLSAVTFVDMPYAPSLLLEVALPIWVTADPGFSEACEIGFNSYFEEMYECSPSGVCAFVERVYGWNEVEQGIKEQLVIAPQRYGERLPWCAGFVLGWLSALALTDAVLAWEGVSLLGKFFAQEYGAVVACKEVQ